MRELPHSHLPELPGHCLARGWAGPWVQSEIGGHTFLRLCFEMRLLYTAVTSGG